MVKVGLEQWKSKEVITARDSKGKILSWRKASPDYPLSRAREEFKRNNAFTNKFKREREELTNVVEIRDFSETKISEDPETKKLSIKEATVPLKGSSGDIFSDNSKKRRTVQYFVRMTLKDGVQIVGRSPALGSPLAKTPTECKERAWIAVMARFAGAVGRAYDADEGRKCLENDGNDIVFSIDEGWVYYRAR